MNQLTDKQLEQIIKAVLFVSGEAVELTEFTEKFGRTLPEIKSIINQLKSQLSGDNGLHLITYGNKAQLSSNPNLSHHISSVLNPIREKALTKAAMQTLAIIAYKQPITRLEIEQIRGVSADYAVQVLLENNMIEVIGRKDVVGRPLLFGTTEEFLKRFDLEDLSSLPDYEQLLDQIELLRDENQIKVTQALYKEHTISDEELTNNYNQIQTLSQQERKKKQEEEEQLSQKLKDIDQVIKNVKQNAQALTDSQKQEEKSDISDSELNQILEKVMQSQNSDITQEELA